MAEKSNEEKEAILEEVFERFATLMDQEKEAVGAVWREMNAVYVQSSIENFIHKLTVKEAKLVADFYGISWYIDLREKAIRIYV